MRRRRRRVNQGGSRTHGASAATASGDGGEHLAEGDAGAAATHTRERREAVDKSWRRTAAAA